MLLLLYGIKCQYLFYRPKLGIHGELVMSNLVMHAMLIQIPVKLG